MDPTKYTRYMRTQKNINYADLNTGLDSEPDYSPPLEENVML